MRPRLGLTKGRAVNAVIAAALLIVVVMIGYTVRGDEAEQSVPGQTATVDTGIVTSTVSASGNVESTSTSNVNFEGAGGIVKKIKVKEGDTVRRGQVLAVVDQSAARLALDSAQASLDAARASYTTTVQGQSSAEETVDSRSIASAQTSVNSAQVSLDSARQSRNLDQQQQNAAVRRAEADLNQALADRDEAADDYANDKTDAHRQALDESRDRVDGARDAVTQAKEARTSKLLADDQAIRANEASLRSAQAQLDSTRASVQVNQQPPRAGTVSSAQAQVRSAQVGVEDARETLAETKLRAPSKGTVVNISGAIGEESSSSSGSTSTSNDSSSGSSSTTTSGFMTLTVLDVLQVVADVAEADIDEVASGDTATVTLSATNREITGVVSAINPVEQVTNNVVEYGVTVKLDETKGVRLGQTSQIVITTGYESDVLRASSSALTTIGGTTTATVQETSGTTRSVQVETGLEGDAQTEILTGLQPGDVLVLPEQAGGGAGFTFPGGGGLGGLGGIG